ncbi:hypothetical protein MAUB1S_11469 [Mycolicibacterium aubagnense]
MRKAIVLAALVLVRPAWAFETVQLSSAQETSVREAVTSALKDPDSVKFGGLAASANGTSILVCGTVNAKNGFGGYSGRVPFVGEIVNGQFELQKLAATNSEIEQVLVRCQNAGAIPADL